jgi:hypothetical protein
MKAGEYYVGDLCYVLDEDTWDLFCDKYVEIQGEFTVTERDNMRVALFSTEHGDGTYMDNFGMWYDVDAGLIGCVNVNDLTEVEFEKVIDTDIDGAGHRVNFDEDFTVFADCGVLSFGNVVIDTAGDIE